MKHVKQSENLAVLEVLILWCVQYALEESKEGTDWSKLEKASGEGEAGLQWQVGFEVWGEVVSRHNHNWMMGKTMEMSRDVKRLALMSTFCKFLYHFSLQGP